MSQATIEHPLLRQVNDAHRIATANRVAAINSAANAIRKNLLTNDEALILIQAITAGLSRTQPVMDTVTQEVIERLDEVAIYLDDEIGE
jgi:hypothetical protein